MSLRPRLAALAVLSVATALVVALLPSAAPADSGGIDNGYGSNGSTLVPTPSGTSAFNDAIKLADGSTVAVGTTGAAGARNILVAKFTPAGAFDTTFGVGGVTVFDAINGTEDVAYGVSVAPSGGFVVAGTVNANTGGGFIMRVSATGVPSAAVFTGLATVRSAVEIANGNYIAVGAVDATTSADAEFDSSSGNVNGTSTVIQGGAEVTPFNIGDDSSTNTNLVVRGDGTFEYDHTAYDSTADTSTVHHVIFGGGASAVETNTSSAGHLTSSSLRTVGARTIAIGGAAPTGSAVARGSLRAYTSAGALDASFGTAGTLLLPSASESWTATDLATAASGVHYVVGNLGATRVRTVRLTSGFALDTTFGDTDAGIADRTYGAAPTRATTVLVDAQDRPLLFGSEATQAASYRVERYNYAATSLGAISSSPSFVQRLTTVTWSYSMSNAGPDRSGAVSVDIDIPASVEGQTFTASSGSVTPAADGSGGVWNVPQLASGTTVTLKLEGKPGAVGDVTTTATFLSQVSQRAGAAPAAKSSTVHVFGAATPRDDVIYGTPQDDTIDALAGNDYVYGRGSDDTLFGNEGNDSLYGETGDDTVDGGNGDDRVFGNSGTDRVIGGSGNDALDGGPGNDRLFGGAGNDLLKGASGNDRLEGGPGSDKLLGGVGNDYLIAQYGTDLLIGGPGKDRLDGSQANDVLYAGTGNDFVNGKTGSDRIYGDKGNDWLRGQEGNDWIWGGSGNDLLNGGAGMDHLLAGPGLDVIRADDGKGGDVVDCGSGWDLVYANRGDKVAKNCEFVKYDVFADTAK